MGRAKDFANWLLYVLEKVSGEETKRYNWGLYLDEFIFLCVFFCFMAPIFLIIYPFRKALKIKIT